MSSQDSTYILENIDSDIKDPEQRIRKIQKNAYYTHLQKELKEKKGIRVQKIDPKKHANQVAVKASDIKKGLIKNRFQWRRDKTGELMIKPKEKTRQSAPFPIEKGRDKILTFLGYKIDFSSRINELKDSYQKLYIEAKSHNYLLAKYSELKFGVIQTVLSLMGVQTEELQKIQKKALQHAVNENKILFEQNEYNYELITIFGMGTKEYSRFKVLMEMRKQLSTQMEALIGENYYTYERIREAKAVVVKKILQELLIEKQTLEFVREFQ